MHIKRISALFLLVSALPFIAACGVDVAGILGQSSDDEVVIEAVEEATATIDEPQIVLAGFFSSLGFTVNYPADWVIEYDPVNGAVLASSQETLDAFDLSGLPDFNALPADSTIVTIQALPFGVDVGTPTDYFNIISESASEDDPFTLGEAEAVSVGIYEGVTASLFVDEAILGTGAIDLYILRVDEETLGLMLGIASGDDVPTDLVEAIIASAQYEGAVFALQPTPVAATATITVEEATETIEEATQSADEATGMPATPTPLAMPTAVPTDAPAVEMTEEVAMGTQVPLDDSVLTETFNVDEYTINYPEGWVTDFTPTRGLTLATSELVLNEFIESDAPNFDVLGEGSVVMNVVPVPFPADQGTPQDVFSLFATDSTDEVFSTGDPDDVVVGPYAGLRSPLTFGETAVGEGSGDLYILRLNEDFLVLVIAVASGDETPRATVESMIASFVLDVP